MRLRECPVCRKVAPPTHFYPRSGKPRCAAHYVWTPKALFDLAGLIDRGMTDAEIGKRMGRTAEAVHIAAVRHGLSCRSKALLSARSVARRLGIPCSKTVTRWIEAGWLKGKRGQPWGPNRQWYVTQAALDRFVADADHWHRWDAERIPSPSYRRWAVRLRGGVRFLSQAEVAERMCVQTETVGSWIEKGWLRGYDTGSRKVVKESDLEALERPGIGGDRRQASLTHRRPGFPAL